ncbi:hypothetical protein ACEZDB_13045 [Streptacidiphilus sp. N1-3]|uniref:Uncharacterized protein n=1 Tax=Streptacidiphilus alkalitolerans TaxID=3342712 RepID=A0ABV6WZV5_9ACTN
MTGPTQPSWRAVLDDQAAQVLLAMHKAGEVQLHDGIVLFVRSLAIEVGAAIGAHRPPAGMRLADGRYAVDVRSAPVLIYYVPDLEHRTIRVCDLIWVAT